VDDVYAEALAEEFLESATSAEESFPDDRDALAIEELGGPFLEVSARQQLDMDSDPSNPEGADQEPFPTAIRKPYG
jgi:hypothetical protein